MTLSQMKSPFRLIPLLALGLGACSLLHDFSSVQCQTDQDCRSRGNAFSDTVCQASFCVTAASGGQASTGGNAGEAGATSGGASSGGGPGGAGPECETNTECIERNFEYPYVCREGKCVSLTTTSDECPIVIGAGPDNERLHDSTDPIIFGAYSYVNPIAPRSSRPTLNYELAIDEINKYTGGGLATGPNGTSRPFIAVICNGATEPDLDESLGHLIDGLGVPAIISSLYAADLKEAFNTWGNENDVFFLSPLDADSSLTTINDRGLLWHLLAPSSDLGVAYPDLVRRTEQYVRSQRGLTDGDPIRVAMVDADTQFHADLANAVLSTISINGASPLASENESNFLRVRVDSSQEVDNPDLTQAITGLLEFKPHILITLGHQEMAELIYGIEGQWQPGWADCPPAEGRCPPFYLTDSGVFQNEFLRSEVSPQVHTRLLGVNFAGSENEAEYILFNSRLNATYPDVNFSLEGAENFYDAAYYLAFAIAAAGSKESITGIDVRNGMERIIDRYGTSYRVGHKTEVVNALSTLLGNIGNVYLQGIMGPPDFAVNGARKGLPSIYCIDDGAGGPAYLQDAMRYDPGTQMLTGQQPCVADFPE